MISSLFEKINFTSFLNCSTCISFLSNNKLNLFMISFGDITSFNNIIFLSKDKLYFDSYKLKISFSKVI